MFKLDNMESCDEGSGQNTQRDQVVTLTVLVDETEKDSGSS